MNFADHLPILPVAIPALAAPVALLSMRRRRVLAVGIGFAACLAQLAVAIVLMSAPRGGRAFFGVSGSAWRLRA